MKLGLHWLRTHRRPVLIGLSVMVLAGLLIAGGGWAWQRLRLDPAARLHAQAEEVVAAVAKIYEVPADESPTLATVSDPQKLANQPFFAKAQVGDRVLFYPQARLAILYRPSSNKVIQVSNIIPKDQP